MELYIRPAENGFIVQVDHEDETETKEYIANTVDEVCGIVATMLEPETPDFEIKDYDAQDYDTGLPTTLEAQMIASKSEGTPARGLYVHQKSDGTINHISRAMALMFYKDAGIAEVILNDLDNGVIFEAAVYDGHIRLAR